MAHNLNSENGQVSFMSTQPAWHNLGTVVDGAQTSQEAIRIAHLDYSVTKRKLYTNGDNDSLVEVPGKWATVRTDNHCPLGVVGDKYTILQNKDAFNFIDALVGSQEAIFETAGALGKGERIFLTCKLPEQMVVGVEDAADNYFFITNSHDGSGSVQILFTNVYVVCDNTLKMALQTAKKKFSVRHTSSVGTGMQRAVDLMGITRQTMKQNADLYTRYTKKYLSDEEMKKFIELTLKPEREQISEEEFSKRFKNTVTKVMDYTLSDSSQLIIDREGTLWGAIQGINGFYNNKESYDDREDRLKSLIYGIGSRNTDRAFSLAQDVFTGKLQLT